MPKKLFSSNNSAFTQREHQHGFTLIELLITIAIISLLFGVVLTSSNALRSASGDAKRKADIAAIQSALQNYYADMNYYPHSSTGLTSNPFRLDGAGATATFTSDIGKGPGAATTKTYMREVPLDANTKLCYVAVDSSALNQTCTNDRTTNPPGRICNYYYLYTRLDNPEPNPPTIGANCGEAAGFFNYQVTP